jgi:hypothetical protein
MQVTADDELFGIGLMFNSQEIRTITILEAFARLLEFPLGAIALLPIGPKSPFEGFGCSHIQCGEHDNGTNNGGGFHLPGFPPQIGNSAIFSTNDLSLKRSETATVARCT